MSDNDPWVAALSGPGAPVAGVIVMGVVNVTDDSFSDGGRYLDPARAVQRGLDLAAEGAAIIDVGGESTRPGAQPIAARDEQERILPVIQTLAAEGAGLISVDTYREDTARAAVAAGAHIINDVWGLQRQPGIARVAADTGAGLVIMHTGREREKDPDVVADQLAFLGRSLGIAGKAGIPHDHIVLDPGFGFAKDPDENFALIARFEELSALGYPMMVGASRKRFIGHATGRDAAARGVGTAATSAVLRMKGAALFRVHDVAINVDALAIADAILAQSPRPDR